MSLKSKWQKFCLNNQKKIKVLEFITLTPFVILLLVFRFILLFFSLFFIVLIEFFDGVKLTVITFLRLIQKSLLFLKKVLYLKERKKESPHEE